MEGGAVGHNIEMGLPKDYPCQDKSVVTIIFDGNFDRVNWPIDMRVWKGRRFEIILKLDRDLR
jgi:hypothetical protein